MVSGGLGVLSTVIGTVSLIGYLTGFEVLYAWINGAKMAFPTALGFIACGVSIMFISEEVMRLECGNRNRSGDR